MDSNSPESPFPPIAQYAFLSDCHTGALVAPDGSIDWLCAPRFDSQSVFGSLLDRGAGYFRFAPYGINVPTSRAYDPGTNVLVTTWHTPSGWVEIRDALTMGRRDAPDETTPHTRPPADDDAEHVLVRTATCLEGSVRIELVCDPAFDYGRNRQAWSLAAPGAHTADISGSGLSMRLNTDLALGVEGDSLRGRHELSAGETVFCSLSWAADLDGPTDAQDAVARIAATRDFWRRWLGRALMPDHRLRPYVERSALVIKGLTYMPTGATVAALTTSLPETPGGERNWDYRYTWMRDSTFTLQALHYLRLDWEADEFMQFVADVEPDEDGALQIMYGIDGRRDLTETHPRRAHRLPGRAARPPRQRRLRPEAERRLRVGAGLDPAAHAAQRTPARPALAHRQGAGRVCRRDLAAARPGHLGGPRQAAALRLVEDHVLGGHGPRRPAGGHPRGTGRSRPAGPPTAEQIKADILEHGVSERGVLRQHYDTDALDASTLLAAHFGLLPGTDKRLHASVLAIADELSENGFVLRYKTDETDDGMSGKEGTFVICSFWLVSALMVVGERQRALDLMERLLRIASPFGLYAEEFEVDAARHLGNIPQAFSHLALIEAAARIILAERVEEMSL